MSKLKVSMNTAIKLLKGPAVPYRLKFQQLYLLPFVKSFKFFWFFNNDNSNRKRISKLWIQRFPEGRIPEVIVQADKMHEDKQHTEVYELLERLKTSKEPNILWRIARALYFLSFKQNVSRSIKVNMITEAQITLQSAFSCGGVENADVHKWMAIILDEHYGLINLENRVKFSSLVRHHLEKACDLNPEDYDAHYMLGKWYYQMCQLSWFQKMIAKYFIAIEPPNCDYALAYKYLSHAEELQPRTMLSNLYFLGNTCMHIGQYFKAKYYLNLAVSLKPRNDNEKRFLAKAKRLMKKLDRYDLARNNVLFYDPLGFNHVF